MQNRNSMVHAIAIPTAGFFLTAIVENGIATNAINRQDNAEAIEP
jgi:hypothetical protein